VYERGRSVNNGHQQETPAGAHKSVGGELNSKTLRSTARKHQGIHEGALQKKKKDKKKGRPIEQMEKSKRITIKKDFRESISEEGEKSTKR